eukprot:TRINITY_DN12784_c0_g1::TRINITY_DN12784_c0_g1_i1::g.28635::m.28635 TRINITY_DN12784_c0_g1::TRINITY_DN12784_c0_g1_i1::g.28635  ORF type:complete len:397 (+),score=44.55 TRINITY_DN12784_c0_g1_i1:58-1191(+)
MDREELLKRISVPLEEFNPPPMPDNVKAYTCDHVKPEDEALIHIDDWANEVMTEYAPRNERCFPIIPDDLVRGLFGGERSYFLGAAIFGTRSRHVGGKAFRNTENRACAGDLIFFEDVLPRAGLMVGFKWAIRSRREFFVIPVHICSKHLVVVSDSIKKIPSSSAMGFKRVDYSLPQGMALKNLGYQVLVNQHSLEYWPALCHWKTAEGALVDRIRYATLQNHVNDLRTIRCVWKLGTALTDFQKCTATDTSLREVYQQWIEELTTAINTPADKFKGKPGDDDNNTCSGAANGGGGDLMGDDNRPLLASSLLDLNPLNPAALNMNPAGLHPSLLSPMSPGSAAQAQGNSMNNMNNMNPSLGNNMNPLGGLLSPCTLR